MNRVFLISSAAYVEAELIAEFGRLPPAFLPLGNRRLFVHQHASLTAAGHRILLSIPEDFAPEPTDAALLAKLGIKVVRVPPGLTLGQSLVYVINITALAGHAFTVLHGKIMYLAHMSEPSFSAGPESLEVMMVGWDDIPWDEIAFTTVELTLQRFFQDRRRGQFAFHCADIP